MTMSPHISGDAWIPTTETFAARLALVRHRMGWNLREAALECGLAMNAWARYEEGMAPRNLIDVVGKVATRTGVDRYWLTFGEENGPRPGIPDGGHLRPDPDSNRKPTGLLNGNRTSPMRLSTVAA